MEDWKTLAYRTHEELALIAARAQAKQFRRELDERKENTRRAGKRLAELAKTIAPGCLCGKEPKSKAVWNGEYVIWLSPSWGDVQFGKPIPKAAQTKESGRVVWSRLIHKAIDVWPALVEVDRRFSALLEAVKPIEELRPPRPVNWLKDVAMLMKVYPEASDIRWEGESLYSFLDPSYNDGGQVGDRLECAVFYNVSNGLGVGKLRLADYQAWVGSRTCLP